VEVDKKNSGNRHKKSAGDVFTTSYTDFFVFMLGPCRASREGNVLLGDRGDWRFAEEGFAVRGEGDSANTQRKNPSSGGPVESDSI